MPQSIAGLTQQGMPLVADGGLPPTRRTGVEGIPFIGGSDSPLGVVAGMAMAPMYQRMLGQVGRTAMGVGHDQNVYDTMRDMQFTRMQQEAVQKASQSDQRGYTQTIQGLLALTGTPFGSAQQAAARNFASGVTALSPMLVEAAPEFMDQLGGRRGSAAVMAHRMIQAGRYRHDPVSGRMGMTGENVADSARRLYDDLYSDANIANMHGVSAGKVGGLIQTLQSRGQISSYQSEAGYTQRDASGAVVQQYRPGDRYGELARASDAVRRDSTVDFKKVMASQGVTGDPNKLTAQDLDKLSLSPEFADKLKSFDTGRIKRSIEGYTHAIGAMRDIFGDLGHPDAPMQQLVAGLDALTMNSSHQMDPAKLSMLVRQTHNLARNGGMSMDAAIALQQFAGQAAQGAGVEQIFAIQAAQGGMGFSSAYRGLGMGAHGGWNASTADELTQQDTAMRARGAGSVYANNLGLIMRANKLTGGFEAGSEADRAVRMIQTGVYDKTIDMSAQNVVDMLSSAKSSTGGATGLTNVTLQQMLMQESANRESYAGNSGAGVVNRRAQAEELRFVGRSTASNILLTQIAGQFKTNGMKEPDAVRKADELLKRLNPSLINDEIFDSISKDEFADTDLRRTAVARVIGDRIDAVDKNFFAGMSKDQRKFFLESTADSWSGRTEEAARGIGLNGILNLFDITNRTVLDESESRTQEAQFDSQLQDSASSLAVGGKFSRAIDELQRVDIDDKFALEKVLAGTFGGVANDKMIGAFMKPMTNLLRQERAVKELQKQISSSADPAAKPEMLKQLNAKLATLKQLNGEVLQLQESFGIEASGNLEAERVITSSNNVENFRRSWQDRREAKIEEAKKEVEKMKPQWSEDGMSDDDITKRANEYVTNVGDMFNKEEYLRNGQAGLTLLNKAGDEVAGMSDRLMSPKMVRKHGDAAMAAAYELRNLMQEEQTILATHFNGDKVKMATELGPDMKPADPEVMKRVQAIKNRYRAITLETHGNQVSGERLGMGDEAEQLRAMLTERGMDPADINMHVGQLTSLEDKEKLRGISIEASSESSIRDALGIDKNLSAAELPQWERLQIAAMKHGHNSEEAIYAALSHVRWGEATTSEQKDELRGKILGGVGTEDEALRLMLGTSYDQKLKNGTLAEYARENASSIKTLMSGLDSGDDETDLATLKRLANINGPIGDDASRKDRMARVAFGSETEHYARRASGMPASDMPEDMRRDLMEYRHKRRHEKSARNLLGYKEDRSEWTPEMVAKHAAKTEAVRIADKLDEYDRSTISNYRSTRTAYEKNLTKLRADVAAETDPKKQAELQKQLADLELTDAPVKAMLAKYGLTDDEAGRNALLGADKVIREQEDHRKKEEERRNVSGVVLADNALSAFGMKRGGPTDDITKDSRNQGLINLLELNQPVREKVDYLMTGQSLIEENSSGFGDMSSDKTTRTEEMMRAYRDAKGDPDKLEAFRRKVGTINEEKWSALKTHLDLRTSKEFSDFGPDMTPEALAQRLVKLTAGKDATANRDGTINEHGDKPLKVTGHLTGDLTIHSDGKPATLTGGTVLGDAVPPGDK